MFFLILLFYIYSELKKKPIGRDTVVSFGDRTYQILKDYYEKDNNVGTDYQLWKDNDDIILKFVYKYKDDSNYKKAYIVGKDDLNANFIYVIINYQKISLFKSFFDTLPSPVASICHPTHSVKATFYSSRSAQVPCANLASAEA